MRSAYGLDSGTDLHWARDAACRHDPDAWSAQSWVKRGRAAHTCQEHCPVLTQCARDLAGTPRDRLSGMVVAGVAHSAEGKPIRWPVTRVVCGRCRSR
jgi:hypothetical protein